MPERMICRGALPEEFEAVRAVINLSFSKNPSTPTAQPFTRFLDEQPLASWEHLRVIEEEGKIVAACLIVPHTVQFGLTSFLAGGFTGVGTHPAHRHQGHALALMKDANNFLLSAGYDLGTLQAGVPELYSKCGYVSCYQGPFIYKIPDPVSFHASLVTTGSTTGWGNYKFQLFAPGDTIAKVTRDQIYDAYISNPAITRRKFRILRPKGGFFKRLRFDGLWLFVVSHGEVLVAYGFFHPDLNAGRIVIREFYSLDETPEVYAFGLAALLDNLGTDLQQLEVHFQPTQAALREIMGDRKIREIHGILSPHMAILLDPSRLLRQLIPTFNARLQAWGKSHEPVIFTIQVDRNPQTASQTLLVQGNFASIVDLSQNSIDPSIVRIKLVLSNEIFTFLTFGSSEPEDFLEDEPCWRHPEVRQLFPVLFPALQPSWPPGDPY